MQRGKTFLLEMHVLSPCVLESMLLEGTSFLNFIVQTEKKKKKLTEILNDLAVSLEIIRLLP